MTQPTQGALVAKRVGSVSLGIFATERYRKARGTPRSVSDLSHHALVGRDRDAEFYAAVTAVGVRVRRRDFAFSTDSDIAQLNAIRAGLGLGIFQVALAARTKSLIRVLPKIAFELPMWLVTHEELRGSRRVAVLFDR